MSTGLPGFFKYNLWANILLLDACEQLTDAQLDATVIGTFGSIRETLMHLFGAEEGYAGALTGNIPTPRLKDLTAFVGFDELRQRAERSGRELVAFAEQGDPGKVLYLDGGTYEATTTIVLIEAIDHAIDHRSQISTLLSQQGIEPPDLDAWSYNDSMH